MIKNDFQIQKGKGELRWPAILAALIIFSFKCLCNLLVPTMRSLPDEIGAIALAANWAGYDWSYVLTHPEMYYGSGTVFFTYPILRFVKDPLIAYQFLLSVGSLLHALSTYIAGRILLCFWKDKYSNRKIICLAIMSSLFTPTRTSDIDNEPMLVLICWLIVYLILLLQNADSDALRIKYSIYMAATLGVAYLSHTRAILYTIVFIIFLFIYYYLTKKILVNVGAFASVYIGVFLLVSMWVSRIRSCIFTDNESVGTVVINSPESLIGSILNGMEKFLGDDGLRAALDLFCGNLLVTFVFTGGIFVFSLYFAGKCIKEFLISRIKEKKYINCNACYFPFMYCMLGYLCTLFGLCITWIDSGINVHTIQGNLTRGHFYLRYYGNYLAPIFLFTVLFLFEKKFSLEKKCVCKITLIIVFIADYCLLSFIGVALKNYTNNLDWFYYLAPFSFSKNNWPNGIQDILYFIRAIVVVVVIFELIIFLIEKKPRKILITMFLIIGIWQYVYGVIKWDRPYALSENYYSAVDSSYRLWKSDASIFEEYDTLYYNNEKFGPAYIVQFFFKNQKVITDMSLIEPTEECLILSNKIIENIDKSFGYVELDGNEFLYTNSTKKMNQLEKLGYTLINNK